MLGRTVSHYRIISQLGAGGMGVVYRAEDLRLGRPVALKFLPEELAKDQQAIDRLRIEARAASALNHTNICTIYDIDEIDGQPFIAMELIKGQTLRDRLEGGALKIHQLVDIGIQMADALDASHSQGIVHRDIKPANIFLTDRNQIKLLDFGLAKLSSRATSPSTTGGAGRDQLTGEGVTLGTVSYMSPEQATGEELDGRTDLFSVGVVLYECATGHRPFTGKTSAAILAAIINRAPMAAVAFNSEMPLRLQEVVSNCLEKDRELRYQSAADLRADLKRVRRDLESGRSEAMRAVVREDARAAGATASRSKSKPRPPRADGPVEADASGAEPSLKPAPIVKADSVRIPIIAGVAIAAVMLGAASYLFWPRSEITSPDANQMAALSETTVRNRNDMAAKSFEAKNYRAALAYASEVLAVAPDDAGATKIRDDSRAMIARFDVAIDEARRRAAANDLPGAAQSLDAARSIDPTAPSVTELAARLAEQLKSQGVAAAPQAPRARPAAEPPRQTQAQAQVEPARPEPPRAATPAPPPGSDRTVAPAAPPSPAQTPAAIPPAAPEPDAPPVQPTPPPPSPAPAAARGASEPAASVPAADDDEAAIRRVVGTYGRAIETKDLVLFRTIKPNVSRSEERRLADGFRAVTSQRVELTILSVDRRDQAATVQVRRRDVMQTGRQQQTTESRQTMMLARTSGGWVLVDIR